MRKHTAFALILTLLAMPVLARGASKLAAEEILIKDGATIVFLGDSITNAGANYGAFGRLVIQGLESEGIATRPVFAGVPGDNSANMLLRLDRSVLDHRPDWVVLAVGVNDIWHGDPDVKIGVYQPQPGMGVDLESYKEYVTRIVERCESAGVRVILSTITPIKEDPGFKLNRIAADYNRFLHGLAKEKGLPIARLHEEMFARIAEGKETGEAVRLTSDGVHPIKAGHYMMAQGILRAMGFSEASLAAAQKQWDNASTMLILGDRITAAGGRTGSWCHLLMDGMNSDREMVTYRSAVNKQTAAELLKAFQQQTADLRPKYVLVQFVKGDAEADTPRTQYQKTVAEIADLAKKQGITLFMTSIPVVDNRPDSAMNKKIARYNTVLRDTAKEKHCFWADINDRMRQWHVANPDGTLTFDGQRFNHEGNAMMATAVLEALGHGPEGIAALASMWDARPSYTFAASHRVSINLNKRGHETLETVRNRYHRIDDRRMTRAGLHRLLTDAPQRNRQRIARFDEKWTAEQLPDGETPYELSMRANFSNKESLALEAKAKELDISLDALFTRAFKVGLHAMATSADEPVVTSRVKADGLTEVRIRSGNEDLLKAYEIDLPKRHRPATRPTPALKTWESYRFGGFVCFNTNQFSGTELCKAREPGIYDPTKLNVKGWVDAMQSAGMKYAVLTTRHTSGFLLWDSPTTHHDVGSSGNTTDVVKEFTDECRKQGIAPGLYYCMWGGKWNGTPNARATILAQLYELGTNYGKIPYFWIDMMNWAPKDMPAQEVYDLLKTLQPDTIVIMNQHVQDGTRIKYFPTDILNGEVVLPPAVGHRPYREVGGTKYYLPMEFEPVSQRSAAKSVAPTPMGPGCWFTYGAGRSFPASTPFPPDALHAWIKQAYERGASNVLLSLAPDHTGSMREEDVRQLRDLGKLVEEDLKKLRDDR